jgi:hypothetical protein
VTREDQPQVIPEDQPTEVWYRPVDIGEHVRVGLIRPELATETQALTWFTAKGFAPEGEQHFTALAATLPVPPPGEHAHDHAYHPVTQATLGVKVHEFSTRRARVWVVRPTRQSRWHHLFDLVSELVLDRTARVDALFGLPALEAQYTASFAGVRHGMKVSELPPLGPCRDYPGQSPSFRNIYCEDHELEIVVQDGIVKYVQHGKPSWAEAPQAPASKRPSER